MIDTITQFFNKHLKTDDNSNAQTTEHTIRLACAILLHEMSRVDEEINEAELLEISSTIKNEFELTQTETSEIIELASEEAKISTCYYKFTSLINREYTQEQKIRLIELMWKIAYADKVIHRHEDHLVRKISELLHVSHQDFIAAKLRVQQNA